VVIVIVLTGQRYTAGI